jgi:hypothetical protein
MANAIWVQKEVEDAYGYAIPDKSSFNFRISKDVYMAYNLYAANSVVVTVLACFFILTLFDLRDIPTLMVSVFFLLFMSTVSVCMLIKRFSFLPKAYFNYQDNTFQYFNGHKFEINIRTDEIISTRLKGYKKTKTTHSYYCVIKTPHKRIKFYFREFENYELILAIIAQKTPFEFKYKRY